MFWRDERKLAIPTIGNREEHTISSGTEIWNKSTPFVEDTSKRTTYGSGPSTRTPTVQIVCERRGAGTIAMLATVVSPALAATKSEMTPLRTEKGIS